MKRVLFIIAIACFALLSCTKEVSFSTPGAQVKIPINLSIENNTRANDTAFEDGDKVGLYVVNYDGETAGTLSNSGNHVDNILFEKSSGKWTPISEIYWKDAETHADFYAYYPYSESVDVTAHPFSVNTDQSEEENYWASDFLWGKVTDVAPTSNSVTVTANHLLSNVLIYLRPGKGFTAESLAAATKTVTINNVKTNATIDLASGVVTATGDATSITPWNTGEYFRAMIVPQTIDKVVNLISVNIEGSEFALRTNATFAPNKQHTYILTAYRTSGGIDISIGSWENDNGVSTVCGTGYAGQTMGPLPSAEISPYYVVADKRGNLFCSSRNQSANGGAMDNHSFIRIDMKNREVSMLANSCVPNSPACDLETGIVSVPTEVSIGSFIEFNPLEMWTPNYKTFTWDPNNTDVPRMPWKHCMVVNPSDGMIYTRYYYGHIARINPETLEAELVCKTGNFDTYGMCFRSSEPNVLYFTNYQSHRIYKLDMNKPREEWETVQIGGNNGGHQDGALADALFFNPAQMCCDAEGNIYVADERNHCIRRINADNTVETVLGTPGTSGYQDGDVETALLNRPRGVTVDDKYLYIADYGNARIRKVALKVLK